jgi:multidrug efflux system outer membrane protein
MNRVNGSPSTRGRLTIAATLTALLAGCTVGPDYERPPVELPGNLGVSSAQTAVPDQWWKVFNDSVLDALVAEALDANRDLKAAAERIEQARAQFTITRSDQFPQAGVQAIKTRDKATAMGAFPLPSDAIYSDTNRLVLRASWELDFWGKYRRATEAAKAELAGTEAGRDAIRNTLIGDVVRGYFALRALDEGAAIAERTLVGRSKSFELQQLRYDSGIVGELELNQVRSDVEGARALIPLIYQRRIRQEGALAVLLGRSPRDVFAARVERGITYDAVVEVPAALPSDLLLRRPDLRLAEERLKASNARIGVARAAYFPTISLTGFYGGESQQLSDLFTGSARVWSVGGNLLQPLFAAGQIQGGVDLENARTREAALLYVQAIANAFRETREAIAAQSNTREVLEAQRNREKALARSLELARLRYDNGVYSLFELLETERQLLAVRLEAVDAERDRRSAIVDLYLALGG